MSVSPGWPRSEENRHSAHSRHCIPRHCAVTPCGTSDTLPRGNQMQHANGDGRDSRFVSAPCLAWKTLVLLAVLLAIALCFAPAPSSAAAAHSVCSGQAHFCLLNTTSQLYCWGVDSSPPWNALPVPAHLAAVEYSSVRCGRFFTCAIRKREKTVDCFGSDEPDGANGPVATSGSIAGIRVSDLALGDSHGLIISEDGLRVYAWGSNRTGQLAVPTLSDAQLALNVSFRSVAAGGSFSCVLFCFPRMDEVPPPSYPESFRPDWFWPCCSGQLQWLSGDPQSPQGVTLGLPFAVYRDLSCAGQLCCLINMDGVMGCMGINEYAQVRHTSEPGRTGRHGARRGRIYQGKASRVDCGLLRSSC